MTCVIPSQSHDISSFLILVVQCIVAQWRHTSSESAVSSMCSISIKCDAQLKAWDILLVLTSVAGNLCNKCPSGYSNKTAVKVILSMRSLVSIKQQSPRRPCDITLAYIWFHNILRYLTFDRFLTLIEYSDSFVSDLRYEECSACQFLAQRWI